MVEDAFALRTPLATRLSLKRDPWFCVPTSRWVCLCLKLSANRVDAPPPPGAHSSTCVHLPQTAFILIFGMRLRIDELLRLMGRVAVDPRGRTAAYMELTSVLYRTRG